MSYARNKKGRLYHFQLVDHDLEWLAYPETEPSCSLRWSTESRTWRPVLGIELTDWTLNPQKALLSSYCGRKASKADGRFFANITAVLT